MAYQKLSSEFSVIPNSALANLCEVSPHVFSKRLERAYENLRHAYIAPDDVATIELVPNPNVCIVCRRKSTLFWEDWGWCSEECKRWLPPQALSIQKKFGHKFSALLLKWKDRSAQALSTMLGLDVDTVRWLVWQHIGYEIKNAPTRRRRRSKPQDNNFMANPEVPSGEKIIKRIKRSMLWSADV